MVQSAIFLALGFLTAALLALLGAPLLWRRAQWVMRRRLEALVPRTLEEMRADRDALRAEHAMAVRRIEADRETTAAANAQQRVEIGRGIETIKARNRTIEEREALIARLEAEIARLTDQVRNREKALSDLEATQRLAGRELTSKREKLAQTVEAMRALEAEKDDGARMLATREAEYSSLVDRFASLERERDEARTALESAREGEVADGNEADVKRLRAALADARMETAAAQLKLDETEATLRATDRDLRAEMADLAARITAMVAHVDGEGSPIADGLSSDGGDGTLAARIAALVAASSSVDAATALSDPELDRAMAAELDVEPVGQDVATEASPNDLDGEMDRAAVAELETRKLDEVEFDEGALRPEGEIADPVPQPDDELIRKAG